VAARSTTGSTAKAASRHKEPVELNRHPMGIESGGIRGAMEFWGLKEWTLSKGTDKEMFLKNAAGRSFRF
jgi:hypothetical protein